MGHARSHKLRKESRTQPEAPAPSDHGPFFEAINNDDEFKCAFCLRFCSGHSRYLYLSKLLLLKATLVV